MIQAPYRAIMNVFYHMVKGIHEKIKNAVITICCFCLAGYFPLSYSNLLPHFMGDENYRMLLVCILVALITIFGIRNRIQKMQWNIPFVIVFYLFVISLFVARYHHGLRAGTVLFALFLLFLLPCYSLVWNSHERYELLFDRLSLAVVIVNLAFYAASIIIWPYSTKLYAFDRYTGLTTNPNIMAMVCLSSVIAGCYLIYKKKLYVLAAIGAGAGLGLMTLTASRAAILAVLIMVIAAVISYLRKREPERIGIGRLLIAVVIVIVMARASIWASEMPVKQFSFYGVASIQEKTDSDRKFTIQECLDAGTLPEDIAGQTGMNEKGVFSDTESAHPVSVEQVSRTANGNVLQNRLQNNIDANDFSSGRLEIYSWIIHHISRWGTDLDEDPVVINGVSTGGTHNAILNFAYQCGWHGGILFFLIELMTAIFLFRFCFGRKEYPQGTLFAVLVIAAFLVEANLENQTLPSVRDLACYYYMIMPVMFLKKYHTFRESKDSDAA